MIAAIIAAIFFLAKKKKKEKKKATKKKKDVGAGPPKKEDRRDNDRISDDSWPPGTHTFHVPGGVSLVWNWKTRERLNGTSLIPFFFFHFPAERPDTCGTAGPFFFFFCVFLFFFFFFFVCVRVFSLISFLFFVPDWAVDYSLIRWLDWQNLAERFAIGVG